MRSALDAPRPPGCFGVEQKAIVPVTPSAFHFASSHARKRFAAANVPGSDLAVSPEAA